MSGPQSKLERRAAALLRAYPAEYRDDRAEEIIGTLLEAAPAGRSSPSLREAWSLIAGGLRARAARNRLPGAQANLRLALLLGLSVYLVFGAGVTYLANALGYTPGGMTRFTGVTLVLVCGVALSPWLGGRALTAAFAIPVAALYVYRDLGAMHFALVSTRLALYLAVLAAFTALILLAAAAVCWLLTDARPALALSGAVLLFVVQDILAMLASGNFPLISILEVLLVGLAMVLPVLVPASWLLLRRQVA